MDINAAMEPHYVSNLKSLALKAHWVLQGVVAGRHRSPFHGFSAEFSQYKSYNPGDDIKHVDWKIYSKSDKLVIRQSRDETNSNIYLLVDTSRSMGFPEKGTTKLEYASVLAASIALLANRQRDAVSLITGSQIPQLFVPPKNSATSLKDLFTTLGQMKAEGETDLRSLFATASSRLKSGSMTYVFTDLWQEPEAILTGLRSIRFKNQAMVIIQILTQEELHFFEGGNLRLQDMETKQSLHISPRHFRQEYLQTLKKHQNHLKSECFQMKANFVTLTTQTNYFRVMRDVLQQPKSVRGQTQ